MTFVITSPLTRLLRPWWSPVLMLIGVSLFSTLGFWQMGRGAEKRELFADFAAGGSQAAWPGLVSDVDAAEQRYQRLRVEGRYDSVHQVLLDNMPTKGRPGYQILTPFRTAAGTVLVNRGWVPASGDREELPHLAVSQDDRTVTGRIDRLPQPGLKLEAELPSPAAPWPRRLFFPSAADVATQVGYPLQNYQLLLDPAEPDGFERQWQPAEFGPERHLGYAVQWFGLAATAVVLWLVLSLRNSRKMP